MTLQHQFVLPNNNNAMRVLALYILWKVLMVFDMLTYSIDFSAFPTSGHTRSNYMHFAGCPCSKNYDTLTKIKNLLCRKIEYDLPYLSSNQLAMCISKFP